MATSSSGFGIPDWDSRFQILSICVIWRSQNHYLLIIKKMEGDVAELASGVKRKRELIAHKKSLLMRLNLVECPADEVVEADVCPATECGSGGAAYVPNGKDTGVSVDSDVVTSSSTGSSSVSSDTNTSTCLQAVFIPSFLPPFPKKILETRIKVPVSMQCENCENCMYEGRKLTAQREIIEDEDYLGTSEYRFYVKCCQCSAEIVLKTNRKVNDYEIERGASRLSKSEAQRCMLEKFKSCNDNASTTGDPQS